MRCTATLSVELREMVTDDRYHPALPRVPERVIEVEGGVVSAVPTDEADTCGLARRLYGDNHC